MARKPDRTFFPHTCQLPSLCKMYRCNLHLSPPLPSPLCLSRKLSLPLQVSDRAQACRCSCCSLSWWFTHNAPKFLGICSNAKRMGQVAVHPKQYHIVDMPQRKTHGAFCSARAPESYSAYAAMQKPWQSVQCKRFRKEFCICHNA